MNTRSIIGRRITAVSQSRTRVNGGIIMTVDSVTLDNGFKLVTHAHETENGDPVGDLLAVGRRAPRDRVSPLTSSPI